MVRTRRGLLVVGRRERLIFWNLLAQRRLVCSLSLVRRNWTKRVVDKVILGCYKVELGILSKLLTLGGFCLDCWFFACVR